MINELTFFNSKDLANSIFLSTFASVKNNKDNEYEDKFKRY